MTGPLMDRRMTQEEYTTNLKIQRLKESVDFASRLIRDPAALRRFPGTDLALLIADVNRSVTRRIGMQSMGADPGHLHWITHEQRILQALNRETERRSAAASDKENKAMSTKTLLPPGARWGTR